MSFHEAYAVSPAHNRHPGVAPVTSAGFTDRPGNSTDTATSADLVVCHGGSGTAFGALAAGVLIVVVPLFADQFENGRRPGRSTRYWRTCCRRDDSRLDPQS
jgi:UDP:flavonoid glycosyltransferase YjiC (YdhE family)